LKPATTSYHTHQTRLANKTFLNIHQNFIPGSWTPIDRMIFNCLLPTLVPHGAFARLLSRQGVLLNDFKPTVGWGAPPAQATWQRTCQRGTGVSPIFMGL
jgi:hypothetical protein